VTFTRPPDFCTLPSTRWATPSFCPISGAVAFRPLKENADVRAATCSPGIFCSTVSSSSLMPSEKYSLALSSLRFANASTATDLLSAGADFTAATGEADASAAPPFCTANAASAVFNSA
jgi:hypothetical protein